MQFNRCYLMLILYKSMPFIICIVISVLEIQLVFVTNASMS